MRSRVEGIGIPGFIAACALAASTAAGAQTFSVGPFGVTCTNGGQLCSPPFSFSVNTTGVLQVQYTAAATHCSNVSVHFLVDGTDVLSTPFLTPGQASATFDLGPVSSGTHTLGLQAEGQVGGCNTGNVGGWGGTAQVTIDQPASAVAVAIPGPGIFATACALLLGLLIIGRGRLRS
jgi:hypothetical protein